MGPAEIGPASGLTAAVSSSQPATCGAVTSAPLEAVPPVTATDPIPTMIEFVSATCPICQRMAPVVAKAEQDCSAHGVRIRQLDVATGVGREAANRYGILGVPTFVFVDQQGTEVARLVGEQPEETLIQTLEVLAGQTCDGFHRLGKTPSAGS